MKLFDLPFSTTVLRFYLMMAVVIFAGFLQVWPIALLALPIFLSCLMGVSFKYPVKQAASSAITARVKDISSQKAAA